MKDFCLVVDILDSLLTKHIRMKKQKRKKKKKEKKKEKKMKENEVEKTQI